jgi:hypothetical protein
MSFITKSRDIKIGNIYSKKYYNIITVFGYERKKSKFDQEEIKMILNSDNACYNSFQKFLSSSLL